MRKQGKTLEIKLLNSNGRKKNTVKLLYRVTQRIQCESGATEKSHVFRKSPQKLLNTSSLFQFRQQVYLLAQGSNTFLTQKISKGGSRMKLQSSNDEQIWCLVSHLLLKDLCLIAPLCQSRSLTVLKPTLLPTVFTKAVRKLTTKFQQNQMRFYVTPVFVINLESRSGLSKNVFSDSHQMFTLHSFFSETRNIWTCLRRD